MSFKIWIEDKQQANGYLERDQAPENLQPRFNELCKRLADTGHYVVLVHGGSVRAQEVFFFEHPDSARLFYKTGFRAFEHFEGEYKIAKGFYKVELFIDGWCETLKVATATPGIYDFDNCGQCLSPRADWDYSSSTLRQEATCTLCGHELLSYRSFDDAGSPVATLDDAALIAANPTVAFSALAVRSGLDTTPAAADANERKISLGAWTIRVHDNLRESYHREQISQMPLDSGS